MRDTGCDQDSKDSLPVPRCLAFLPLRAADIATRCGLLVGSKGEREAAGGMGTQRQRLALPGEAEGAEGEEQSSPAWLCRLEKLHETHAKPQNYNTLPGLLEVMGELTCL